MSCHWQQHRHRDDCQLCYHCSSWSSHCCCIHVVADSYWILPRSFVPRMWYTDCSCGAKHSIMHRANATFNESHPKDHCYALMCWWKCIHADWVESNGAHVCWICARTGLVTLWNSLRHRDPLGLTSSKRYAAHSLHSVEHLIFVLQKPWQSHYRLDRWRNNCGQLRQALRANIYCYTTDSKFWGLCMSSRLRTCATLHRLESFLWQGARSGALMW